MKSWILSGLSLIAAPVVAKDAADCLPGLICASAPATVIRGMQDAGYKAKLDKDDNGDPMISSAASGYDFELYFYGCEAHDQCDSLQFSITFTREGYETAELVNLWNAPQRFAHAFLDEKDRFRVVADVTTVGGVNPKNFDDAADWWSASLADLAKFWDKHPNPKAPKKAD